MSKLRCVSRYDNVPWGWHFQPGAIFEVTEEERRFLMADSPGSFEDYAEPKAKRVAEPPQDKAVKSPPRAKSARRSE
jgi:hypothetical protein